MDFFAVSGDVPELEDDGQKKGEAAYFKAIVAVTGV